MRVVTQWLGLRLYVRGQLPGGGRKAGPIEVYADTRFLTATGKRLKGCGMELIEGQGLIDSYLAMLPDDKPKTSPQRSAMLLPILHRWKRWRNAWLETGGFVGR